MLPIPARLLGVANSYCALLEDRPHRPACSPSEAAKYLLREGEQGRLDSKAVHAVLEASGHRVLIPRQGTAAQLSPREIEVLRLMARGLSNRQMASQLSISEKTVGHHVQHIYNKIGVSTRAGATLFAIQHDLLSGTL
jgi:DNA-binding NarL/FixJ family response regulator